jgi:MraZ protein
VVRIKNNKKIFMFIGEYQHNLDDKGRIAIPAKFRLLLKKGGVVTKGLDNCLFLYTKDQWRIIAEKLSNLPVSQSKARALARHFLAGAMDLEFDNQGRVTLPEYLRHFAGLKKNVIIAGLYNHLEIWNKDDWDKYKEESEKNTNMIAEDLGDLGI